DQPQYAPGRRRRIAVDADRWRARAGRGASADPRATARGLARLRRLLVAPVAGRDRANATGTRAGLVADPVLHLAVTGRVRRRAGRGQRTVRERRGPHLAGRAPPGTTGMNMKNPRE